MGAAALRLDDELTTRVPEPDRPAIVDDTASSSSISAASITRLQNAARLESLRWQPARSAALPQRISCRTVISGLLKQLASGGEALAGLPIEDRDWLLDNLRVLKSALRDVMEPRRGRSRQPHIQSSGGPIQARTQVIAAAFLNTVNFSIDPQALSVYLQAWQENQKLEMGELWALKPAMQLHALNELAEAIAPLFRQRFSAALFTPVSGRFSIPRLISALRDISEIDWELLFEQVSVVDGILSCDPATAYSQMDQDSRSSYRAAIAELASCSGQSESQAAETVLSLAQAAVKQTGADPVSPNRLCHVGYYLVDDGLPLLRSAIGYRPNLRCRLRDFLRRLPNAFYLVGIELLTLLIVIFVLAGLPRLSPIVVSFCFVLIPATQAAVELMNAIVTSLLPACSLPKLDFSSGIPDEYKTMVAVPALLLDKPQVQHILDDLEVRYLANRDPNLYFALLTDGPDSPQPFDEKEVLAGHCSRKIRALNRKYGASGKGPFFLFHRHRTFNPSQNAWMGWERKRGKLLDLSRLLRGDENPFPVKVGDLTVLSHIRFVITLDADTQLPREAAQRLVGTLAHPLNRAVIDPVTNTVTAGYGILQPRVGISVQSASRSWLASIYSGQTGFDIYTRAVSDVYQDLYGEGSFAGKGIFDVAVFHRVLNDRFPCNTLLSHDLIEGAYARAALVSDVEVIEDYPSHFSAYSRRRHRWVRGDWQISQWLFPRVPDYHGRMVANPTSVISRWKIFDNLRRSLVDPSLFGLLLAGWLFLPEPAWYWTAVTAALLLLPGYVHAMMSLLRTRDVRRLPGVLPSIAADFAKGHLNALVTLTFLPHQTLVMIDAIVRTIVRHRITGCRLLEWETAAEAETGKAGRRPVDTYLEWTPWIALMFTLALSMTRPEACPYAIPFLLVWACAPAVARWLSREKLCPSVGLSSDDRRFLRNSALHIWRFFQESSGPGENWLIPDNVQESECTAAHRISPTNLGLLLNARQAACELGYMTLPEFVAATGGTFSVMALLPRFRGHFFNWYDTLELRALDPAVVSTVDSGNLAASLWTLKQGCLAMAKQPVFRRSLWQGLMDHVRVLREIDRNRARGLHALTRNWGMDGWKWVTGLDAVERAVQPLTSASSEPFRQHAVALLERISAIRSVTETLAPWLGSIDETAVLDLIGNPASCFAELTLDHVEELADQFRSALKSPKFIQLICPPASIFCATKLGHRLRARHDCGGGHRRRESRRRHRWNWRHCSRRADYRLSAQWPQPFASLTVRPTGHHRGGHRNRSGGRHRTAEAQVRNVRKARPDASSIETTLLRSWGGSGSGRTDNDDPGDQSSNVKQRAGGKYEFQDGFATHGGRRVGPRDCVQRGSKGGQEDWSRRRQSSG